MKITVVATGLTQYYVVRSGDSTIFMATYITEHPSVGELRFIARLQSSQLPSGTYLGADTSSSSSAIEGSDVVCCALVSTHYTSIPKLPDAYTHST